MCVCHFSASSIATVSPHLYKFYAKNFLCIRIIEHCLLKLVLVGECSFNILSIYSTVKHLFQADYIAYASLSVYVQIVILGYSFIKGNLNINIHVLCGQSSSQLTIKYIHTCLSDCLRARVSAALWQATTSYRCFEFIDCAATSLFWRTMTQKALKIDKQKIPC